SGKEPGKIPMMSLLVRDPKSPGGLRPNRSLLPPNADQEVDESPGHYRRVTLDAWCQLVEMYGVDGPAIAVRGIPHNDISRWRVFMNPTEIDVNLLPEPELPNDDPPQEESKGPIKSMTSLFG
ncbi:unnamed protein product, partial [Symbiodinium microadriaticum]